MDLYNTIVGETWCIGEDLNDEEKAVIQHQRFFVNNEEVSFENFIRNKILFGEYYIGSYGDLKTDDFVYEFAITRVNSYMNIGIWRNERVQQEVALAEIMESWRKRLGPRRTKRAL